MTAPLATIDVLPLGPLETNAYVLRAGDEACIVDPGGPARPLLDWLARGHVTPSQVWLTHAHYDHIAGLAELKDAFPEITVFCPRREVDWPQTPEKNMSAGFGLPMTAPAPDEAIEPGQTLALGPSQWQVLDTAGHTPGGVSFYCKAIGAVLTGDALFAGSIGRTDLPDADHRTLAANIQSQLLSLPEETAVWPGHGPATTIGREAAHNPFLNQS